MQRLISSLLTSLAKQTERLPISDATKLMGGFVFLIRVGSAGVAYLIQILFARWMGPSDYGVYVYAWTWVIFAGGMADLGFATTAQRFIPQYRANGDVSALRGLLFTARVLPLISGGALCIFFLALVFLCSSALPPEAVRPLYIASLCVPLFVIASVQDGVARSHHWVMVGLVPDYLLRPIVILAIGFGALLFGIQLDATLAMSIALVGTAIGVVIQRVILKRRLASSSIGEMRFEFQQWRKVSIPIFAFAGFYLALMNVDILMLNLFRSPAEVAVYFAASKTFALVAFVSFAVSTVSASHISEFSAQGQSEQLKSYLAQAVQWTFWPSLAGVILVLAVGRPLLQLFGPSFVDGYELLFVMAVGLMAQASTGPAEAVLNMQGQETACAKVYAISFVFCVLACALLIPPFGIRGAAIAVAAALTCKSLLLFLSVKQLLSLHAFILRPMSAR